MNINEIAEKAVELKTSGKYNCAQSVTAALADETSLTQDQLCQISAGFCAGMGEANEKVRPWRNNHCHRFA